MTEIEHTGRRSITRTTIDVVLLSVLSFVAQATHFSAKQGRAVICADSAQYVASAEAILDPGKTPHFEMRKPGYTFFLAGLQLAFGNMGWSAIVANHALLALLPVLAYAFGCHLHSRAVGWFAGVLTVARLQGCVLGDRMMSESLFTFLFSLGLLLFIVGLTRQRLRIWILLAGAFFGLAWLTRGTATPVILAAALFILVVMRGEWRRAVGVCVCFTAPIIACIVFECSLNKVYAGGFRPADGTAGMMLLLRARNFEGFDMPDTAEASELVALLPERDGNSAFVAEFLDAWVARYRAIHDHGMSEWESDGLMGRVGADAIAHNFPEFLKSSLQLTWYHLLRDGDGQSLSPVTLDRQREPIRPAGVRDDEDWDATWFAHFGLPHMEPDDSMALVERMNVAAATRAPFGESRVWSAFRYWISKPLAERLMSTLNWLGSLWPGFALVGCGLLGLNRKCCLFLAMAYVCEALFIGFLTPTTDRLQFIWIVTDTMLASGVAVGMVTVVLSMFKARGFRANSALPYARPLGGG